MLQEIVHLGQIHLLQGQAGLRRGLAEFQIPRLELLQALDVGGELVRRLDQGPGLPVILLPQPGGVGRAQLLRQQGEQLLHRELFHPPVRGPEFRIKVLHRRGKIPREDLRRVVKEGGGGRPFRVGGDAHDVPADDRQRVGQHRHHVGVLLDILRFGAAHQAPAADIPHPGQVGEERTLHHTAATSVPSPCRKASHWLLLP